MMEYHHVSPNHLTGLPLYVEIAVNEPIPPALSTDVRNQVVNIDIAELRRSDNFFLLIKDHQNIWKGEPTIDAAAYLDSDCLGVPFPPCQLEQYITVHPSRVLFRTRIYIRKGRA